MFANITTTIQEHPELSLGVIIGLIGLILTIINTGYGFAKRLINIETKTEVTWSLFLDEELRKEVKDKISKEIETQLKQK